MRETRVARSAANRGWRWVKTLAWTLLALVGIFLAVNIHSLVEGTLYLTQALVWKPHDVQPIQQKGPFAVGYELVGETNAERHETILDALEALGLRATLVPIPGHPLPNILVPLSPQGPYTLLVAHYDKSRETATYQGALDNTGSVALLLSLLTELSRNPPARPTAVLFSAYEEIGSVGAQAFLPWADDNGVLIDEVINLDMVGRDAVAARPSAWPGFYFWLPCIGDMCYDGAEIAQAPSYAQPDRQLLARLDAAFGPDLVRWRRITACGDGNVFQDAGYPTVTLSSSNANYLLLVWEQDSDRIELLDEGALTRARDGLIAYLRLSP